MPQCPHCQNEYEKGQRYCSVCGSFLLHPEEGDTFAPNAGSGSRRTRSSATNATRL